MAVDFIPVQLRRLRSSFHAGNRKALMQAIALCAKKGLALPQWAATEFLVAYDGVNGGQFRDWNAAFGPARPKGVHMKQRLRVEELADALFDFYPRFRNEPAGQNRFEAIAEAMTATGKFGGVTGSAVDIAWRCLSRRERSALNGPGTTRADVNFSRKVTQTAKAA